jgi:hypothetical protein
MPHTVFFFLSVLAFLAPALVAAHLRFRKKSRDFSNGIGLVTIGAFFSLMLLHIPVNNDTFGRHPVKTLLVSAYNALQTFPLNGNFDRYEAMRVDAARWLQSAYPVWASVMYILAPILAFGFALSLFKNLSASIGYILGYRKDAYIFSALNERSVILAESIRNGYPQALLVFANAHNSAGLNDFADRCAALNALRFGKTIRDLDFGRHSKTAALCFFLIDDDESINERDASALMPSCKDKTNVRIYVRSERVESDLLLQSLSNRDALVKLFRIDETHSLVFNYLYENSLFETAVTVDGEKVISVVIIGLDKTGEALLKAISWCGQMNGYKLIINAFDESPAAESRLRASCPELIKRSGVKENGEAYYEIVIHNGIDYGSSEFLEALRCVGPITTLFVTTGNDERNIDISLNAHIILEQNKILPPITVYVRNPHKAAFLREQGLSNFKRQKYNIAVFGDLESCYSHNRVMYSRLEQKALDRHKKWGAEIDFYTSEYNYRSSMASVIRKKWRDERGIAFSGRAELEHKGWNAYMRSIGYSYSGSTDKASRNDRARLHHDLVAFDKLSEEEKRKDEAYL